MKNKRENGEVVVEATIVVTIVMIFMTIMLYLGMVMYQKTLVTIIANQTASNLAQLYSNNSKDTFTGYIDADKVYQPINYEDLKTDAYLDVIKQKAEVFSQYRLKSAKILASEATSVDVQIVSKHNDIMKCQIVVNIRDKYDVPLVGFFAKGAGSVFEFAASGRADCVDILEYLNGVQAISNPDNSTIGDNIKPEETCLVNFVVNKYTGGFHAVVPVTRGESIISSNRYTHSKMPLNPQYNGLKFKGWVYDNGSAFSSGHTISSDTTVYGSWECTVTFDPTGGKVSPKTMAVALMKTAKFPTPERDGYAFEGWYTGKNGTGDKYESNSTEIEGNITLYAKWRCLHKSYTHTMLDAGNCKTKSTWLHKCKTCDYSYTDRGKIGDHVPGDKTNVSASCTTGGYYVVKCTVCNASVSEGKLAALGHRYAPNGKDYDEKYFRAATCNREGIDGSRCSRCGVEKGTVLQKTKHEWGHCGVLHTSKSYTFTFEPETGHKVGTHRTRDYYCRVCIYCHSLDGIDPYNNTSPIDGIYPVSDIKWCGYCNIPGSYQEVPFHD
ncbi:MAG: InlB B-repeat-containing protein [Ruminococcus sp.]|nr:InlB B-repeat-containing protein [Ruminococcus sp.]